MDDYVPSFLAGGGSEIQYAKLDPPKPRLIGNHKHEKIQKRRCRRSDCRRTFKPVHNAIGHCSSACTRKTQLEHLARYRGEQQASRMRRSDAQDAEHLARCAAYHEKQLAEAEKRSKALALLGLPPARKSSPVTVKAGCTPMKERRYRSPPRKCKLPECDVMFSGPSKHVYCSRDCFGKTRRVGRKGKVCHCGKAFWGQTEDDVSCSLECKYAAQSKVAGKMRDVIRMRGEGMTVREVAAKLGVSNSTIVRNLRILFDAAT